MTVVHTPERVDIPSATDEPEAYVRALLEVADGHEEFAVIAATPARVRALSTAAPADVLTARPEPDEWSSATILGHLYDVDIVYGFRWRLVLTEDNPSYPGYEENAWSALPRLPFWQLLNAYESLRASNVALLRGIPEQAWRRTGGHGEQGEEDLARMVRKVVGHDIAHLNQLYRAVRAGMLAAGHEVAALDAAYRQVRPG